MISDAPTAHRAAIADYINAGRHVLGPGRGRRIAEIAKELGMDRTTARRWLRQDHPAEWMEYWPTVEDLFAESERERQSQPVQSPPTGSTFLRNLPSPEALLAEFDPLEDELMNAQRFASYRHHRQGLR